MTDDGGKIVPVRERPGESAEAAVKSTVGVIGLGAIGGGVATNLVRHGFPLVVNDVRRGVLEPYRAQAVVAESPTDLARRADVVVVAVVDEAQLRAVVSGPDGVLAAPHDAMAVVVLSTVSTACIRDVGREAGEAGVALVDCGVSGGPSGARDGELVCMVGGDVTTVERLRPVFDAIGSLTILMGPLGSGLAAKIARNLVQYGSWLAAYEAQRLAEAAGIELAKLAQAVKASDARIGGASTLMFRPTVAPFTEADDQGLVDAMRSAAGLAKKDLVAALDLGDSMDVDLPLAQLTEEHCDEIFGVGPTSFPGTASGPGTDDRVMPESGTRRGRRGP